MKYIHSHPGVDRLFVWSLCPKIITKMGMFANPIFYLPRDKGTPSESTIPHSSTKGSLLSQPRSWGTNIPSISVSLGWKAWAPIPLSQSALKFQIQVNITLPSTRPWRTTWSCPTTRMHRPKIWSPTPRPNWSHVLRCQGVPQCREPWKARWGGVKIEAKASGAKWNRRRVHVMKLGSKMVQNWARPTHHR